MANLTDFIAQRVQQLADSLLPLRAQQVELEQKIASIEKELADLRNAAKAIGMPNGLSSLPLHVTRRTRPQPTIKEAIMSVLPEFPEGLLALDILAKINARFDLSLVRTSLSPQLTRLKREGRITNRGSIWLVPNPNTTHA
jgi:hypothetical protein